MQAFRLPAALILSIIVALACATAAHAEGASEPPVEKPDDGQILVQPKMKAFGQTKAMTNLKDYTAKISKRKHATAQQINKIHTRKTKLFTAVNKLVRKRARRRDNFIGPWIKGYKKQLMKPAHSAYNKGIRKATRTYNKATRRARKARDGALRSAARRFRRHSGAAYATSERQLKRARHRARKRGKKLCKKQTKAHSKKRRVCRRKAAKRRVPRKARRRIINALNNELAKARRERTRATRAAVSEFDGRHSAATKALRKQQGVLLEKLDKERKSVAAKAHNVRAANEQLYAYLRDKESRIADRRKDQLRAAIAKIDRGQSAKK